LDDNSWCFEDAGMGALQWQDAAAAELFRLVTVVWQMVRPAPRESLAIRIDSSQFMQGRGGLKLGLGSSAAVASSLVAALQQLPRIVGDVPTDMITLAAAAHKEYQGGRGSGVDIAASMTGGIIRYQMHADRKSSAAGWPDGLLFRFLWSGKAAVTTEHIDKYAAGKRTSGAGSARTALIEAAREVARQWSGSPVAELLKTLAAYTGLLRRFSDEYQLGIFAAGHDTLTGLASDCGIVYKPCGAGGGDIGVAMTSDESSLSGFCQQAVQHGFTLLDVLPDWHGVVVETESKE
jgi:phosphomevalonate kinase